MRQLSIITFVNLVSYTPLRKVNTTFLKFDYLTIV